MSRIANLPWYDYRITQAACAQYFTQLCRTNYGTETLREIQGAALQNAYFMGLRAKGICGFMRVGCGKTLTAGLIPFVQNAKRPIQFVPGGHLKATKRQHDQLRLHWKIPLNIRLESYEKLSHRNHRSLLLDYQPDCIVNDEAHNLANPDFATCAKRMGEYRMCHPSGRSCSFNWMTGSGFGKSLKEIAHLIYWALLDEAPIPDNPDLWKMWADCLDNGVEENGRRQRGDLSILVPHLGPDASMSVEAAQAAFGRRIFYTPGIIISTDAFVGAGLEIEPMYLKHDRITEEYFDRLRQLWEMPDGWILGEKGKPGSDGGQFGVYHAARQMKHGFYYVPDPRPPVEWIEARREHFSNVRYIAQTFPELDSVYIVTQAIEQGRIPWALDAYRKWKEIEPKHPYERVAVWFSRTCLDACIKYGRAHANRAKPSVIWVAYNEFGQALSKETGWPYYGAQGLDARGKHIDDAREMNIIASVQANQEGRNLQYYADALLTNMQSGPKMTEQQLGRHHRDGTKADVVKYTYLVGCKEDVQAIYKAYEFAKAVKRQSFEQEQKLCQATIEFPDTSKLTGPAYQSANSNGE